MWTRTISSAETIGVSCAYNNNRNKLYIAGWSEPGGLYNDVSPKGSKTWVEERDPITGAFRSFKVLGTEGTNAAVGITVQDECAIEGGTFGCNPTDNVYVLVMRSDYIGRDVVDPGTSLPAVYVNLYYLSVDLSGEER